MDYLDCPFCERVLNEDYDRNRSDDYGVCFEPLNPVTPGHLLVVSRVHLETPVSSPYITGKLMDLAAQITARLNTDANIITSSGPAATQTVRHCHLHIVPRHAGDGLKLPWTDQPKTVAVDWRGDAGA
jgi:histidine triad (HIT) family protein